MPKFERLTRPNRVFPGEVITLAWYVDDGDVWLVQCMDCGIRIGTVNAGNVGGAETLTSDHNRGFHR